MSMKRGPKRALIVLGVAGLLYGYRTAAFYGIVPRPNALKSMVPLKVEAIDAEVLAHKADVKVLPLPSNSPTSIGGPTVRFLIWAWNANMAAVFANGGRVTTKGSLNEQAGVKISYERQDDNDKMKDQQLAFAESYCKNGVEPTVGVHFVDIMGNGAAGYIGPANEALKAYKDPACQLEIVAVFGYSRGEDKFMGPAEWKANPQSARGGIVFGVPRDGDWDLTMDWENQNKIPNNPDKSVYDPNAINWVETDSYTEAAAKYVSGECYDRPVKDKPSQAVHFCPNVDKKFGVVTWTPGDVTVAQKRGGLVSILDTGTALFQMPCVVVGNKKWDAAHPQLVAAMIAAAGEAADQIRVNNYSNPAFKRASEISYAIYKEQNPEYWARYFKGVTERDATGVEVALGGSAVSNIADMFQAFGLSGGPNLFKATYETFSAITVQQYPNLFKSYPPVSDIQNTRYLQMAAALMETADKGPAEKVKYTSDPIQDRVSSRDYSINFDTGKSTIRLDSYDTLNLIAADLETNNLKAALVGHTDNTGITEKNQQLSEDRAASVKAYLLNKGGRMIPGQRIVTSGAGQSQPVASNATADGRAKNRRVSIALGR